MKKNYRSNKIHPIQIASIVCIFGWIAIYGIKNKVHFIKGIDTKVMLLLVTAIVLMALLPYGVKYVKAKRKHRKHLGSTIYQVDKMDGLEFEHFLLAHFKNKGYTGKVTKGSHDYGADLVVSKEGETIVVQAKRYKGSVGVSAVQQISAAKTFYKANKAMVITNSYYTAPAKKMASANDVILIDRTGVDKLING